jgi:penicillin-binding protein 2
MSAQITIKDYIQESQLTLNRTVLALAVIALLFAALVGRLTWLQVTSHAHYRDLAQENRVKIEPLVPTRGLILDRHGRRLAVNLPAFSLELTPELVDDLETTLAALGELVEISDSDLERFRSLAARQPAFERLPLRFRLTDDELARLAIDRHRFPGVDVQARLDRYYPYGAALAHALGYVGRINVAELQTLDPVAYRGSTHVGKLGVEKAYEAQLHGVVGLQEVEVNAQGRELRVLKRTAPAPGQDLRLALDVDVQAAAIAALNGQHGAVVAIDVRDGGVLALVSEPAHDPNLFVHGISRDDYATLTASKARPLFNRALVGRYPPGSTIKPFLGLAGLASGTVSANQRKYCPGFYQLEGREHKYRDWKKQGHGPVDLHDAISQSCDVYFYGLAHELGIERMHDYLAGFGFGRATGIDVGGESPALLPSPAWKRAARNLPWYPGETLITGIGQGFMQATPLQLAVATAQLARGGLAVTPRLVLEPAAPPPPRPPPSVAFDPAHFRLVVGAMTDVVHGARGTARRIGQGAEYRIAGKTGTAQVFGIAQEAKYEEEAVAKHLRDHGLFIGFAPADDPRIAVAVVVENGGSGSRAAAPVARAVMDRYLLGNQW